MPLHGLHHRSHSNSNTPEVPASSSLIQAAQALAGIGAPQSTGHFPQQQHHTQQSRGGDTGALRVQTSSSNLNTSGGITPIHSGSTISAGAFSATSSTGGVSFGSTTLPSKSSRDIDQLPAPLQIHNPQQPLKKNLTFHQLPSPTKLSNQGDLYQSPTSDLHLPIHRPSDPTQVQQLSTGSLQPQYQAYHASQPSSNTGSRPQIQSITTAPGAIPQSATISGGGIPLGQPSMHRTNTSGTSHSSSSNKYAPSINTSSSARDADPSTASPRKYTHPGALTPTYPTSSQHSASHSHSSGTAHLGMGLSGMASGGGVNSREREDVVGGIGAVGNGRWMSPYALYALDWCKWPVSNGGYGRVAMCSYAEDSHNYIQILDTRPTPVPSSHSDTPPPAPSLEFSKLAEASHTYPITRILWEPASTTKPLTDLIATSGDHLRLWSMPSTPSGTSSASATPAGNSITRSNTFREPSVQKLTPLALLSNSKSTDFTAPLTSLDWNPISPSLIITSSIDTTCTIWDIPTLTAKTQLIAHDKEVYDVRFMSGSVDVFASCGADGSVRMFDLRSLEHSTIIYEPGVGKGAGGDASKEDGGSPVGGVGASPPPLLRLAASPHDTHLIATFSQDSNIIRILDVRQPGQALIELKGHTNSVNCVEWNPTRRGIIAGGADDSLVLIWDLINNATGPASSTPGGTNGAGGLGQPNQERIPVASWKCDYEVNNISWSPSMAGSGSPGGEWLGVLGGRGIWGVKV